MQDNTFTEKLYTSTEVAQILGVSLRSIYRYLDENKIQAEVKTATGRHRFTKQNINDFLHPGESQQERYTQKAPEVPGRVEETERTRPSFTARRTAPEEKIHEMTKKEEPKEDTSAVKEEPVDWLARFRQAAEKYKTQEATEPKVSEPVEQISSKPVETKEIEPEELVSEYRYYRSAVGGLKEIAQSLDKSAKNASLDYAFTMNAGLSLHKPIKPFSLIHAYVRPTDLGYFEKVLQLTSGQKDTAQLCLIPSNDQKLYDQRVEMHGLYVVSDNQIKLDLLNEGEVDLANELE